MAPKRRATKPPSVSRLRLSCIVSESSQRGNVSPRRGFCDNDDRPLPLQVINRCNVFNLVLSLGILFVVVRFWSRAPPPAEPPPQHQDAAEEKVRDFF